MNALLIGGSVLLLISLALAWLATAVRILNVASLKKRFPAHDNLIKAHIDYLLMALLLFVFYLIGDTLSLALVVPMLIGATINPFLFIVFATYSDPNAKPSPLFMITAFISFVCTTVGFGGAAIVAAFL